MAKRKLTREKVDWEKIVKVCLHKSAHTMKWGCLNTKGKLFRIATLDSVQVPMGAVKSMCAKGKLKLGSTLSSKDMYIYVPKKERKSAKRTRKTLRN